MGRLEHHVHYSDTAFNVSSSAQSIPQSATSTAVSRCYRLLDGDTIPQVHHSSLGRLTGAVFRGATFIALIDRSFFLEFANRIHNVSFGRKGQGDGF